MRIWLVVLICCSLVACKQSEIKVPDEDLVDVGGYRVYFNLSGKGDKTIVLIPGLGDSGEEAWKTFALQIGDLGQVLYYDPSGLGKSGGKKDITYERRIEELHTLVEKTNVKKPYMLVAHSIGNWIARLYAEKYRSEVSGLVLLDPTGEERDDELIKKLPSEDVTTYEAFLLVVKNIFLGYDDARAKVRQTAKLDELPTAVVYAEKNSVPDFFSQKGKEVYLKVQEESQLGFKNKFKQLVSFEKATGSGHYIQKDKPGAAISAIKKVQEKIK